MANNKNNMKKQTSVQWLQDSLDIHFSFEQQMQFEGLFQQALEMEKQQIINTWYDCKLSIIDKNPTDADQYFNKNYKK